MQGTAITLAWLDNTKDGVTPSLKTVAPMPSISVTRGNPREQPVTFSPGRCFQNEDQQRKRINESMLMTGQNHNKRRKSNSQQNAK